MMNSHVWLNGSLVEPARAQVPFLTSGLHYGIGVFEGIRCYAGPLGPAIFRLPEHITRLIESAHILGFSRLPYSHADLMAAVTDTVRASGHAACYIRPLIYLAEGGWDLTVDSARPHTGIAVWPWTTFLAEDAKARGIRANVSSFTRHHPNVMMTKAKIAGNYANSVLARTESKRLGFEEAIMLDAQGYVAECTGENIFIVRNGTLITPPAAAILEGITRDTVMLLAADLGYGVAEASISRDALYRADEVFVCGTAAEIAGLSEIDFRTIGSGRTGPITGALQEAFHSVVTGAHPRSAAWLTPVGAPVTS